MIERLIKKIYNEIFKIIYSKRRLSRLRENSRVEILNFEKILSDSEQFKKYSKKYAEKLAILQVNKNKSQWRKYYKLAKKKKFTSLEPTYTEYEENIFKNAITQNFEMIKSIPQQTLKICNAEYTSTLIEEVAKGSLSRGSFEKLLNEHKRKNAKLIARTETAKLQSAITENRSRKLGSKAYFWLSSHDQRTRESHREMNGVIVFWRPKDEKPLRDNMRGNAGEFPNCRCAEMPIVDTDDITKPFYKVYNYHTDTIVTMSKREIIKALEQGYLD